MARVIPATHTFIHKWNEPRLPLLPIAERHRTLAGTHDRDWSATTEPSRQNDGNTQWIQSTCGSLRTVWVFAFNV